MAFTRSRTHCRSRTRRRPPSDANSFRPHVSLAYSNAAGPAEPIAERLAAQPLTSAEVTVHRAALIDLNRDHRAYQWTEITTAGLRASAP